METKYFDPKTVKPGTIPERVIQPKLEVNPPNDKFEQEADQVADKVSRMPGNATDNLQMQPKEDEEKKLQMKSEDEDKNLQMKPEDEDKKLQMKPEEEDKKIQMKSEEDESLSMKPEEEEKGKIQMSAGSSSNNQVPQVSSSLASQLNSTKGQGSPLSEGVNQEMGQKIGGNFNNVRVHTDDNAVQMSKEIGAKAFTHGNDIYFNNGQYNPSNSSGKSLLAHELTHVIQQKSNSNNIQRKIIVNGKEYNPTEKYKKFLRDKYNEALEDTVVKMASSATVFKYDSYEKMGYELRTRYYAMKNMDIANQYLNSAILNECCHYPSTPGGYLNPKYWEKKGYMDFVAKLSPGDTPAQAVESIFKPDAKTELECQTMTIAVEYYAFLKSVGEAEFNKKFPGGSGLLISVKSTSRGGDIVDNKYDNITISSKSDLLPGDWVYFKNFSDYGSLPGSSGIWTGENAIVNGPDKFSGFGLKDLSEKDMNERLVKACNDENRLKRTVPQLLIDGGGLLKSPVYRPNINKLLP